MFPETRLTAIQAAASEDPGIRRQALEVVITAYWKPVYKHIRLRWQKSADDASDLTQGYFEHLLDSRFFRTYDRTRGSFRTFLLSCLDAFLTNQHHASRRLKRGGGFVIVSLDHESAEEEIRRREPVDPSASAEDLFYREWTRNLFAIAVKQLEEQYSQTGKQVKFDLFRQYDLAESREPSITYEAIGKPFGLSAVTVTNYLSAARRDFRRAVLRTLRDLTGSDAEYRAEARRLLGTDSD